MTTTCETSIRRHRLHLLVVDAHLQRLAPFRELGAARLDVERQCVVARHGQRPGGDLLVADEVDLVGQADADQRTARALRAVLQRGRHLAPCRDEAQAIDRSAREGAQFIVEGHGNALPRFGEVEHAFVAAVAVLFQDHALHAELHALGIVGAPRHMRAFAALVVDRGDVLAVAFDEVHACDQPEPFRRQGHRARMETLALGPGVRIGQLAAGPVHATMAVAPVHGV
jgi:hypothetical protein